mgnify:CR=1 FL=1
MRENGGDFWEGGVRIWGGWFGVSFPRVWFSWGRLEGGFVFGGGMGGGGGITGGVIGLRENGGDFWEGGVKIWGGWFGLSFPRVWFSWGRLGGGFVFGEGWAVGGFSGEVIGLRGDCGGFRGDG